jgi:hypothetical protein
MYNWNKIRSLCFLNPSFPHFSTSLNRVFSSPVIRILDIEFGKRLERGRPRKRVQEEGLNQTTKLVPMIKNNGTGIRCKARERKLSSPYWGG